MKLLQELTAKCVLALAILFLAVTPVPAGTLGVDTTVATSNGTIRARAKQVILIFSSDFEGTVNGVDYSDLAGWSVNFGAPSGDDLSAITYTVTAGSIKIIRVQ
jgi:hypothetical protein